MRTLLSITLSVILLNACSDQPGSAPIEGGAFITYLGQDTLAAESFRVRGNRIEASVMLRTPSTSLQTYVLELDASGHMQRMESRVNTFSADERPARRQTLQATESGFDIIRYENGSADTLSIEAPPESLPFLDMIHWPYDLVLNKARTAEDAIYEQPLLTGRRARTFEIRQLAPDSMTIKHPSRGTMGVTVNAVGQIGVLDAGQTTRKVRVIRTDNIDVEQMAKHFAQRDDQGASFGPLSGRAETEATFGDAVISLDYGTPSRRGRHIFGNIVPWGAVWRTGANRATHMETDQDLLIGDLVIPAGQYTLYTIPEADGGTLIINKQTGQGGTTYSEDQDLGRIPMVRTELSAPIEVFSIEVVGRTPVGSLAFSWGYSTFSVPLSISN